MKKIITAALLAVMSTTAMAGASLPEVPQDMQHRLAGFCNDRLIKGAKTIFVNGPGVAKISFGHRDDVATPVSFANYGLNIKVETTVDGEYTTTGNGGWTEIETTPFSTTATCHFTSIQNKPVASDGGVMDVVVGNKLFISHASANYSSDIDKGSSYYQYLKEAFGDKEWK